MQKTTVFTFQREEWTLFRSVATLSQKAGVSADKLRRVVLKELADNALDAGGDRAVVTVGKIDGKPDTYFVEDNGPGITPEAVARLFSIDRQLVSTKLLRLPTRGALGNGLRVVAGAVVASSGTLTVISRNTRHVLTVRPDGGTLDSIAVVERPIGTRIEVGFGPDLPADPYALRWAENAIDMATGNSYGGKSSPHWYSPEAFYELLQAAGDVSLRELVAELDGCSGSQKSGAITAGFKGLSCEALSRPQAAALLTYAQTSAKPVRPERLGSVGMLGGRHYAKVATTATIGAGASKVTLPIVVEAWTALKAAGDTSVRMFVNRTPTTAAVEAYHRNRKLSIFGCGLEHAVECAKGSFDTVVNVTTPWCPITTDGKEPDLSNFVDPILDALVRSVGKAKRAAPRAADGKPADTAKDVVLANLDAAIAKASDDGKQRFLIRQLYYVVRPYVGAALGKELSYENFGSIITGYEAEHGDIAGMYRDPRGNLYHPHTGEEIALGTLAVERYRRPDWTFNKVIYVEKEGLCELLKSARWPERNDCALVTSKGFASRAVRDLLDLLGDHDEPVTVFCVHDADAAGTMIYQTLQEETAARGRRTVEIVNLGLEPWEALAMGLDPETVEKRGRVQPVADYVQERWPDGDHWSEWLQRNRIELNEMTTSQFIAWLDRKMVAHDAGRVCPPAPILEATTLATAEQIVRRQATDRILREAGLDAQVAAAMAGMSLPPDLADQVARWLLTADAESWRDEVGRIADSAVIGLGAPKSGNSSR